MPYPSNTLGYLEEHDMNLTAYCETEGCRRCQVSVLSLLIARFGRDQNYINTTVLERAMRCAQCGGRHVMLLIENTTIAGSHENNTAGQRPGPFDHLLPKKKSG